MRRVLWGLPALMLAGCSAYPETHAHLTVPAAEVAADPTKRFVRAEVTDIEAILASDPVAFLRLSLERADAEVRGYTATLLKQERLAGRLGDEEEIAVAFRERPFSVRMEWRRGHKLARKTLYVEGAYGNQIVAQLSGWRAIAGQVTCAVDDEEAKANSRYPITEFGMVRGARRALASWEAARERGDLSVSYLGKKKVAELNDRECWVVRRVETPTAGERLAESTFYYDAETWLQLGTDLRDDQGRIVAKYLFRDVVLNPTFDDKTFCRVALKK